MRYRILQILVPCIFFKSTLYPKEGVHYLIFHVGKSEGVENFSDAN